MKIRVRAALFLLVGALSACADSTNAIIESAKYAVQRDTGAAKSKLNPDFRYLLATVKGRNALLVLGYVDSDPQGPIEVWYSAEREVLRIQNGRIVGAVGLTTEWRNVFLSGTPSWSSLADTGAAARLRRVRDVMPGYRYGLKETLLVRPVAPPSRSALEVLDPQSLSWFEESVESETGGSGSATETRLPVSRYALGVRDGEWQVVYGEQCLSANLCFAWQRWPAIPVSSKESR